MSNETLTPVLTKRRNKQFKGVMARNVNRIDQLSRKLQLKVAEFQPWKKWTSLQPDDVQFRQAYYWFGEISRIWKLPYTRQIKSYAIKQVHLNANYQNSIFVNIRRNNSHAIQGVQPGSLLKQQFYVVKQYNPAYKQHLYQTISTGRHIQRNITRISQLFDTEKVKQCTVVSKYKECEKTAKALEKTAKALTVERIRPTYVVKNTEIEHFSHVISNAVSKNQRNELRNNKHPEQAFQQRGLDLDHSQLLSGNVSNIVIQRSLEDNKILSNSIRRFHKNLHVVHRHDVSFIKHATHAYRNIAVSNINHHSGKKHGANKHKPIQLQQSALASNVPRAASINISNEQYSLRNSSTDTPGRRFASAYEQGEQNYSSYIRAKNPPKINTCLDRQHYVYSYVNPHRQTNNQENESIAVAAITGQTATGAKAQWIEYQIEQQIKKRLTHMANNAFNRKRIAREIYQSMSKQLVRERERLGR